MAIAKGHDLRVAIAKAATWGTQVADPTTDALLPCLSWNCQKTVESLPSSALNDSPGRGGSDTGVTRTDGSFSRYLHYQGDEIPLALVMGTAGSPSQVGTTSYYTHTYTAKSSLQGLFASLFADLETNTEEVDSAKLSGMTISGSRSDGRVTVEYRWMGRELDIAGDIAWGSVTENANALENHVLFNHCSFYLQDAGGADPTAGTSLDISDFSFTYDNNLAEHFTNAGLRLEPVRNDFISCSGSVTIDTYENTTHVTDIVGRTAMSAVLQFTSGSYGFEIQIPRLRITGDLPSVSGPGRINQTLNWEYEKATSNPTGYTSTLPAIEVISQMSTDPLA